jgi:uncharacterized HAD superfamily protein
VQRPGENGVRRIYVDMDDVLCATAEGFLSLLNRSFDRSVAFEEIVSFDLSRSFDLSQAELQDFMERAHQDDVLSELDPIPGALEGVMDWTRRGYEVEVVTGRPPSTESVSRQWLDKFEVPYESLTFLAKYSDMHSEEDVRRAKPLSALSGDDYCLAIEDSRDMAHYLAGTLGLSVALMDRPWNRNGDAPLPAGVVRCQGWAEVVERFSRP